MVMHIFMVKLDVKRTFLASWLKERGICTRHFFLLVAAERLVKRSKGQLLCNNLTIKWNNLTMAQGHQSLNLEISGEE